MVEAADIGNPNPEIVHLARQRIHPQAECKTRGLYLVDALEYDQSQVCDNCRKARRTRFGE